MFHYFYFHHDRDGTGSSRSSVRSLCAHKTQSSCILAIVSRHLLPNHRQWTGLLFTRMKIDLTPPNEQSSRDLDLSFSVKGS